MSLNDTPAVDTRGVLEGYACVFRIKDHENDVVLPQAFRATLSAWQQRGSWPKMLWQHDLTQPIGVWDHMHEDDKVLYVRGRLLLDLRQGQEAYTLVKAGVLDGLSIGYRILHAQRPVSTAVPVARYLTAVDLIEVSLVTLAANPKATLMRVKQTPQDSIPLQQKVGEAASFLRGLVRPEVPLSQHHPPLLA